MRILLTGAYNWNKNQLEQIKAGGWKIIYVEREDEKLPEDAYGVDAVVCNWLFIHHSIDKFYNLKFVQLLSAGIDRVPISYIKKNGINLYTAKGVYSIPMAEYAVCGVLQILKHSQEFADNQRQHIWKKNRNLIELSQKRICVIGAGNVGNEVGKRFAAFTDEVYAVDVVEIDSTVFKKVYSIRNLDAQLKISDIVVLTIPLTETTRGMFDRRRFENMKEDSIFVNIARGGLVVDEDLLEALDSKLLGAVLDVFEEEPLPENSKIWDKKNVIITPHNSFVSNKNDERMWKVIKNNIINLKK